MNETMKFSYNTDDSVLERFERARAAAAKTEKNGIGTLGEKGIHRTLKYFYEPDESCHEINIGGYVADIVNENGIIEIQSGSFGSMKKKLAEFLECSPVTIVYPCAVSKCLIMLDPDTGEVLYKRRSPKKSGIYDVIGELWSISDFLENERLEIRVVMVGTEEIREQRERVTRGRRRRKKNYTVLEKYPTSFLGEIILGERYDYRCFLPEELPEEFTTADMRRLTGMDSLTVSSTVNLLRKIGVVERIGKKGNSYIYKQL